MNFIGVDLHKKSITICVMDEKRKAWFGKHSPARRPTRFSSSAGSSAPSRWSSRPPPAPLGFVEPVEPLAEKVVLANPKKLRVIAESTKKTDRLDAQVLTVFLVLDIIPESYQPTPRQRQHRALAPPPPVSPGPDYLGPAARSAA